MKRLPTLLTAALLLLTTANAKAQVSVRIDSLLFENSHRIDSASCGELRLNFDALCFFRDNEYKGYLSKGYTLPGYRLQPTVSYQPLKNLRVEVGVSMLHYWGANKYPNLNYSDMEGRPNADGLPSATVLQRATGCEPKLQPHTR